MHIAAERPLYVSREEVPAAVIDREKSVYTEQLKTENKPAAMFDKIIEGKLNAYYKMNCFLEQAYIKDDSKTVQELINEKVAEIGEKLVVRRFARYELGEGIEKAHVDFAAEVAEQLKQ
jgi:elongation factor Ts